MKCGKVTEEERDQIKKLYIRKTALTELFSTLSKCNLETSTEFYDKVVMDFGEVTMSFHSWWEKTAQKYGWPSTENGSWKIDFETCEISLT
jgi:CXXX repeat modification system protein